MMETAGEKLHTDASSSEESEGYSPQGSLHSSRSSSESEMYDSGHSSNSSRRSNQFIELGQEMILFLEKKDFHDLFDKFFKTIIKTYTLQNRYTLFSLERKETSFINYLIKDEDLIKANNIDLNIKANMKILNKFILKSLLEIRDSIELIYEIISADDKLNIYKEIEIVSRIFIRDNSKDINQSSVAIPNKSIKKKIDSSISAVQLLLSISAPVFAGFLYHEKKQQIPTNTTGNVDLWILLGVIITGLIAIYAVTANIYRVSYGYTLDKKEEKLKLSNKLIDNYITHVRKLIEIINKYEGKTGKGNIKLINTIKKLIFNLVKLDSGSNSVIINGNLTGMIIDLTKKFNTIKKEKDAEKVENELRDEEAKKDHCVLTVKHSAQN